MNTAAQTNQDVYEQMDLHHDPDCWLVLVVRHDELLGIDARLQIREEVHRPVRLSTEPVWLLTLPLRLLAELVQLTTRRMAR